MVTMVQFEARMAVLSEQLATQYKEKVSALEKNVTALKSQVAEDQAAATARILDLYVIRPPLSLSLSRSLLQYALCCRRRFFLDHR